MGRKINVQMRLLMSESLAGQPCSIHARISPFRQRTARTIFTDFDRLPLAFNLQTVRVEIFRQVAIHLRFAGSEWAHVNQGRR